jgi:beta-glucosidase/6-phospho-beta-glucosidase/beta-galactosidase
VYNSSIEVKERLMRKMKPECRESLKDEIRFSKNLIVESQVVMDRILSGNYPEEIKDKIRRIKNAINIDVEEMDRIMKLVK